MEINEENTTNLIQVFSGGDNIDNSVDEKISLDEDVYYTYIGAIVLACLFNLTITVVLLFSKRNGVLSLILQLTLVDALTAFIATLEVSSIRKGTWSFSSDLCPLFAGGEVLVNSILLYLIISFNFHIISLINLQYSQLQRIGNRNPLTRCLDDDSNECLVQKSENTTRTLTINYNKNLKKNERNELSVFLPSILIWFISISISIPQFTLTSTIKLQNITLCTVVDTYYSQLLQRLLLVFRVVIPEPLLIISALFLIIKLTFTKNKQHKQLVENEKQVINRNNKILVLFSLLMTLFYCLTSTQRDVFYLNQIVSKKFLNGSIDVFKTPPLHNTIFDDFGEDNGLINCLLSIVHYSGCLLRPLLYFCLPDFRAALRFNLTGRNLRSSRDN